MQAPPTASRSAGRLNAPTPCGPGGSPLLTRLRLAVRCIDVLLRLCRYILQATPHHAPHALVRLFLQQRLDQPKPVAYFLRGDGSAKPQGPESHQVVVLAVGIPIRI